MPDEFRMSVGAHPGAAGEVNAAFAEFAEAHGVPTAVRRSLNIALDELLANVLGEQACAGIKQNYAMFYSRLYPDVR